MKEWIKSNWWIITIVVFAIIKQLLVTNVPIAPYPNQGYDDGMMVEMAVNIREGNWLGKYTSNILVKGPAFPIILAIINYLGLSYIGVMNFIYTLACIYFIYCIKDMFKSKVSLCLIYVILLFNPVSYAFWTLQRVYRNGITLAQGLIIISSLFAMYRRREQKAIKSLPFAIIGGITAGSLWLTREDGMWILPFIIVVVAIMVIYQIIQIIKNKDTNKDKVKQYIIKIGIAVLPMIIIVMSLHIIRLVNYKVYGIYAYNEINDGYFGKVIKSMYSVKTDENVECVTVTKNKIKKIYEVSETLREIKPYLDESVDAWSDPELSEVKDGFFWWALKQGVENAGKYENAQKADEFYKKVYEEIELAKKEGKLQTQSTMPATLMSPWRNEYFIELPKTMLEMLLYVTNYDEVKTVSISGDIPKSSEQTRRFEAFTNDLAIYQSGDSPNHVERYTKKYTGRLNNITKIYQKLGLIVAILATVCYIVITINMIKSKQKKQTLDIWLFITGIACTMVVLLGGVSYNHISAVYSKYYMYLSGIYPLVTSFCMLNICYVGEHLIENIKRRKNNENSNFNTML